MPRQKHHFTDEEIAAALDESNGVVAHAAKRLGVARTTLVGIISKQMSNGLHADAPPGYAIKGISALVGPDGEVKQRWIKTQREGANMEALQDALEARFENCRAAPRVKAPKAGNRNLLTVYPYGDPHVGMMSWSQETGESYDLKKTTADMIAAARYLVDASMPSDEALIAQLGDFYHADDPSNRTPTSKHALDVDGRYGKVLEAGIDAMCTIIDTALAKHKKVTVINSRGNHDPTSAICLSVALKHHYRENPRVEILEPNAFFHYYPFGDCLIGVTHGDAIRGIEKLAGVMATDEAVAWGATKHRYWLTGHVHHRRVIEAPGVMIESFRTLAARDAYAAKGGYRSGRDMYAITYDKEHGEVGRIRCDIGRIR